MRVSEVTCDVKVSKVLTAQTITVLRGLPLPLEKVFD